MGNFTQATPPPAALAAPDALRSSQLITEIQTEMYEAQKDMALTLQQASTSLGAAIKESEQKESQTLQWQSVGMITQGAIQGGAEGKNVWNGRSQLKDPALQAKRQELEHANSWESGLTDLQKRSQETIKAQRDNGYDKGYKNLMEADINKPFSEASPEARAQAEMGHTFGADAYTSKLQAVRDRKKAIYKEIDGLDNGYSRSHQQWSAFGQAGGAAGNGGFGIAGSQSKFQQAMIDEFRQAAQTENDSVRQVFEQTGQGAHKLDDQKEGLIRTLQQGLADANRA